MKLYYSCQIKTKCSPVRFLHLVIKIEARLSPGGGAELDSHQDFCQVVGDKFRVELNFRQAVAQVELNFRQAVLQVELYFHRGELMKRRDKGWRVARGWLGLAEWYSPTTVRER